MFNNNAIFPGSSFLFDCDGNNLMGEKTISEVKILLAANPKKLTEQEEHRLNQVMTCIYEYAQNLFRLMLKYSRSPSININCILWINHCN